MSRRYRSSGEHNVWPVIADCFVGILAVVVFLFSGITPPVAPPAYFTRLKAKIEPYVRSGVLQDQTEVTPQRVRLVYSREALSFAECSWDLSIATADLLRAHLRLFDEADELLSQIQIEGHADLQRVGNCQGLVPYRDNLQLSQNRARAVLNVLLGLKATDVQGLDTVFTADGEGMVDPELAFVRRLGMSGKLQVAGFGQTRPLSTDPADAVNRRVEILVYFKQPSPPTTTVAMRSLR